MAGRAQPGTPGTHTHAGYDLLVAPLAFNGQYHLHFYPTLGRLLRQLRPDILHMDEEPYNLATWLAVRPGQDRRRPLPVLHLAESSAALPLAVQRASSRQLHAARLTPSPATRRRSKSCAPKAIAGPVTVIPQFGVDPDIFSPRQVDSQTPTPTRDDDPSSFVVRPSSFTIGYAGRLVPEKGVDVLLAACAALPSAPDWTLHVLGDGPDQGRLAAIARELSIAEKVRFLGRVPSAQTPHFYRTLDVLVLPSLSRPNWVEQFGRVLDRGDGVRRSGGRLATAARSRG